MNIGDKDQAMMALLDMADLTRQYFVKLIAAGFSEDQALTLTINWQNALVTSSISK